MSSLRYLARAMSRRQTTVISPFSFAPMSSRAVAASSTSCASRTTYNNSRRNHALPLFQSRREILLVNQQQQQQRNSTRRRMMSTAGGGDYPAHTLFPMPALSPTMEMGTITSWSKAEGESFIAGDTLCTIETDKASVDFEAQDDGILAKILRQDSNAVDLPIGTPICVVVEDEADVSAFANFTVDDNASSSAAAPAAAEAESAPAASGVAPATTGSPGSSLLLPSARHLSESKGLDATVLQGSGKGGRVTKGDVMAAIQAGILPPLAKATTASNTASPTQAATPAAAAASAPPSKPSFTPGGAPHVDLPLPVIEPATGSYEEQPNSKMRKVIATRLTQSKREVPHFYTSMNVALDSLMKLRKKLAADHEVKISVNDFIIKACAMALRDVPEVNGTFNEKTMAVEYSDSIDVSVAVATPTGLITPIVFGTDKLGLADITSAIKDLAGRARDGKLAPHEYQGGTFSVSNLGMFGIREFSAVINPPQAAILAVGGGDRTIVPTPYVLGAETQAKPTIATLLTARLSADRRVVDEATAALFTGALRHYLEEPTLLVL